MTTRKANAFLDVDVKEAFGKAHGQGFGGDVDFVDPGGDEGDEKFGSGKGVDNEERSGVLDSTAGGGCGELDIVDGADWSPAVEDGAIEEVRDVLGVLPGEFDTLIFRDEEVAGLELLGGFNGVDALEFEDDATGVAAQGEPMGVNGNGLQGAVGVAEGETGTGGKVLGEVGEELGKELSLSTLGTKKMG